MLVFVQVNRLAWAEERGPVARPVVLIASGVIVFGLGYALFLTNANALVHPTGIANRIAIASSIGVALGMVGVISGIARVAPGPLRSRVFAAVVCLMCASGVLILNGIARFWVESYQEQQEVMVGIERNFPELAGDTVLILDGVCPYRGPAIVFESNWDLAGMLMTRFDDRSLQADVTTANLTVAEDGLHTVLYGAIHSHYPYGQHLLVYDAARQRATRLPDHASALTYFGDSAAGAHCPAGEEGFGVPIF